MIEVDDVSTWPRWRVGVSEPGHLYVAEPSPGEVERGEVVPLPPGLRERLMEAWHAYCLAQREVRHHYEEWKREHGPTG